MTGRHQVRGDSRSRRGRRRLALLVAGPIVGAGAVLVVLAGDVSRGNEGPRVAASATPTPQASPASAPAAPAVGRPVASPGTGARHPTAGTPNRMPLLLDRHDVYAADGRGMFSASVRGIPARVYVPNTLDGTVSVIDPRTYRVVRTIAVRGQPHHVTPSWDLRHLYVDNPGAGDLTVIDPRTARVSRTIQGVSSPYNLYFSPDGSKALVVAERDQVIEFRDPHTWRLLRRLPIPGQGVDHMDFSPDGRFLLVSDEYDGLLVRVSVDRMRVTGTLRVGGRPIDVKVAPDGSVFFVANQGLSGVSVVDPATMRQVGFIPTGVGAHGFAVSRNGSELYLSNRVAGTISVIRFSSRRVVATWDVGGSPDMLQVSPDGMRLWASNRFGTTVSVVSTRTGKVVRRIRVGRGPHGLCYFPEPGRYSIGHNGVYR